MSSDNDGSIDAVRDGRCPKCAGRLFEIIPHQTTWHAIEEFLQAAVFEGADLALTERWIHPGSYCHQHGCLVLAEFGLPELRDGHEYRVFLTGCGKNRKELIVQLKKSLDVLLPEAKDIVSAERPRLAAGSLWEISTLCERLEDVGAELEIEQRDKISGDLIGVFRHPPAEFSTHRRSPTTSSGLGMQAIVDDDGTVEGMMDGLTAEYLESNAPKPSQRTMDKLFAGVQRVRIIDEGAIRGEAVGEDVLLTSAVPKSIEALHDALRIVEDADFGHCMCLGDIAIELYDHEGLVATISLHHAMHIRWDAWKDDGALQAGDKILDWLSDRGVTGPREEREADKRRDAEYEAAMEKWLAAMPECLRPLRDRGFAGGLTPLQSALETALADVSTRVLAILEWFGAGKGGSWNNYPSYEWMPGKLLLEYPTTDVVQALMSTTLTPGVAEGAARYLGSWEFRGERRKELKLLPTELKKQLLKHVLEHSDRENSDDARGAFGDGSV